MTLVERVRRSLRQAPSPRAAASASPQRSDVVANLRRKLAQMEATPPSAAARRDRSLQAVERTLPTPRECGQRAEPLRSGQIVVHRMHYGAHESLGIGALAPPEARSLERIADLVHLETGQHPSVRHRPAAPATACSIRSLRRDQILFFDTETTGLSRGVGTLPFIIGLGGFYGPNDTLQVDQILIEDPASEDQALQQLIGYLERARVLVSYNGRSFDLPILRNRAVINRIRLPIDQPHLDLLSLCRRLFRARLSDCRLRTVERELLGFAREHDLDGSEAPAVYAEFLRTGYSARMDALLQHNSYDVVALAVLLTKIADHVTDPLHWAEDADELYATGSYQLQGGDPALAEVCMQRALDLSPRSAMRQRVFVTLAQHYRRSGRILEALAIWQRYRDEFPNCSSGWIEPAKLHEHVTKDLARALALAEAAPEPGAQQTRHRIARLKRRLQRVR